MKKYTFLLILVFASVIAMGQSQLGIVNIEPKQIPSKYSGNSEYQTQGAKLIDSDKNSYPQPYWGTSSPLIYDLDLGSNKQVASIKIFDFEGGGIMRIYTGSTNNWTLIGDISLNDYKKEKELSINKSTQYMRVEIDGKVSDISIWGTGGTNPPPPPPNSDVIMSLIEVSDSYAKIQLDSLFPESTYQISVNGENVGSFITDDEPFIPPPPADLPHVVHISVDGLRSDIVEDNLNTLPNFSQLVATGSATFNAKTDPDYTVTNPNHISMWTALNVSEHGQTGNGGNPGALPDNLNTVFEQVADNGGNSSAYLGKEKLKELLSNQPARLVGGSDDDNINSVLSDSLRNYTFLHIKTPDDVGHASGWESSLYLNSIREVDNWIGELLSGLPPDTWFVITSDHGGTGTNHADEDNPLNNTIPLFIYNSSLNTSRDLYKINPNRDIIRNGETGNISLDILGLAAIPQSTLNADFSLCWDCDTTIILPPDTSTFAEKTLDEFIGTNVLADDDAAANLVAQAAGNIRVYQYLKWLQGDVSNADLNAPLSSIKINFSPNDAFGFNHDASTKTFSDIGETYITLFESAMYLVGNNKEKLASVAFNMKDGRNGLDNPNRWKYVSHLYFQVAARYGKTQVDNSKLITDSEKKSGLGYCDIIEGGNEKDRWWKGHDDADLSPEEHAAYYSAVYDGHMNTMQESGVSFGVKNADPQMKLMLGGLAFVDFDELMATGKVEWFERFFKWFEDNRTNPNYDVYPVDIIAYHDYPNTERKQRNLSGKGQSPENYQWYEKTKRFVEYIQSRVTAKKLLVVNNEFGYDRNQGSPQRSEPYGGFNAEQVAGFWTVRCMLDGWAAGLYSAAQFYFRENGGGGGIFQSSGLTDKNQGYKPFQMFYYFAQTREAMKDHSFVSRQVIGDMVKIETVNKGTGKKGWILWHFSESNKTSNYTINANGTFEINTMRDSNVTCQKNTVNSNGSFNVSVSERPVYITQE